MMLDDQTTLATVVNVAWEPSRFGVLEAHRRRAPSPVGWSHHI